MGDDFDDLVPVAGTAGAGHDDCAGVLRDVWRFLDDELDPEHREAVQAHLDGCSPCLQEADLDYKLKLLLHEKCGGETAPDALRTRLIASLRSMTVTAAGESVSVETISVELRADLPPDASGS